MSPGQYEYVAPASVEEAVQQLQQQGARVLAGGTSLLRAVRQHRTTATRLVDLRRIGVLQQIEHAGSLRISAMATYDRIAADAGVQAGYPALYEAVVALTDPQVRNRATLGGSLASNDAAGDVPAAALALAATVHVAGAAGKRTVPVDQFLVGPQQTGLAAGEILIAVEFPAPAAASGSAYEKFRHPASGRALCGVAVFVQLTSAGKVQACRVALTGAASRVTRLPQVEGAVTGRAPGPDTVAAAQRAAGQGVSFVDDAGATAEYRAHLAGVLVGRALARALQRAGSPSH